MMVFNLNEMTRDDGNTTSRVSRVLRTKLQRSTSCLHSSHVSVVDEDISAIAPIPSD